MLFFGEEHFLVQGSVKIGWDDSYVVVNLLLVYENMFSMLILLMEV